MRLKDKWNQPIRLRHRLFTLDVKCVSMTDSAQFGRIHLHHFVIEVIRRKDDTEWTSLYPLPQYVKL